MGFTPQRDVWEAVSFRPTTVLLPLFWKPPKNFSAYVPEQSVFSVTLSDLTKTLVPHATDVQYCLLNLRDTHCIVCVVRLVVTQRLWRWAPLAATTTLHYTVYYCMCMYSATVQYILPACDGGKQKMSSLCSVVVASCSIIDWCTLSFLFLLSWWWGLFRMLAAQCCPLINWRRYYKQHGYKNVIIYSLVMFVVVFKEILFCWVSVM